MYAQVFIVLFIVTFTFALPSATGNSTESSGGLAYEDVFRTSVASSVKTGLLGSTSSTSYIFSNIQASWYKAKFICENNGMKLASILTGNDQASFAKAYKLSGLNVNDVWLGGSRLETSSGFAWTSPCSEDSQPFTFTNWVSGQPDNTNGAEECVEVWIQNNFMWNDNYCDQPFNFACQNVD